MKGQKAYYFKLRYESSSGLYKVLADIVENVKDFKIKERKKEKNFFNKKKENAGMVIMREARDPFEEY